MEKQTETTTGRLGLPGKSTVGGLNSIMDQEDGNCYLELLMFVCGGGGGGLSNIGRNM